MAFQPLLGGFLASFLVGNCLLQGHRLADLYRNEVLLESWAHLRQEGQLWEGDRLGWVERAPEDPGGSSFKDHRNRLPTWWSSSPRLEGAGGAGRGATEGAGERSGHQADLPEPSELYLPGSPQDQLARLLVISVTHRNTGLAFDL